MAFASLPLLAIGLLVYNALAFTTSGDFLTRPIVTMQLPSGDPWAVNAAMLCEVVALGLLFVELIRATASSRAAIINHALSIAVFVIGLIEFLLVRGFGNSTFFILLVMLLLDVVAGFTITIVAARRDLG